MFSLLILTRSYPFAFTLQFKSALLHVFQQQEAISAMFEEAISTMFLFFYFQIKVRPLLQRKPKIEHRAL